MPLHTEAPSLQIHVSVGSIRGLSALYLFKRVREGAVDDTEITPAIRWV